jgi:hypothetical protein
MSHYIVALVIVSLVGCAGLTTCPPRPRAQEFWGTIAIAPLMILIAIAALAPAR